jgi:hypothetical protein
MLAALAAATLLVGLLIATRPGVSDVLLPSADCGQEGFLTGNGRPDEVRRCILMAYEQHARAHSAHLRETLEGDPITYRVRVSGRDDYELTVDASKDRFGSGKVTTYRCAGMRSGGGDVSVLRLFNCGAGVAGVDL